jgi:hypothetical protein
MPPIVIVVLGAIGAIAAAKWLASEARRINAELHPETESLEPVEAEGRGTLRRDPTTGVYRPHS